MRTKLLKSERVVSTWNIKEYIKPKIQKQIPYDKAQSRKDYLLGKQSFQEFKLNNISQLFILKQNYEALYFIPIVEFILYSLL